MSAWLFPNLHVPALVFILGKAPKAAISLNPANFARALYQIVGDGSSREQAFLVTEKNYIDNFTSKITAISYDDRYYNKDQDYNQGLIDEDGNLIIKGILIDTDGNQLFDTSENALIYHVN